MPPKLTEGELYIMGDRDFRTGEPGPYVKIGIVRNEKESAERLKEHQTGNPREIVILETARSPMVESLETHLHHHFAERWVNGEWFDMNANFVRDHVMPIVDSFIAQQLADYALFARQEALKKTVSSGESRAPTQAETSLHAAYCAAKTEADRLEAGQATLKLRILEAMGPVGSVPGVVNVQVRTNPGNFDLEALLNDHPEEAASFMRTKPAKTDVTGRLSFSKVPTLRSVDEELHAHQQAARAALRAITVEQGNSAAGVRDANLVSLHGEYVAGLGPLFTAKLTVERLKAELACALGEDDGITGLVSWARKTRATPETTVFDKTAFKKVHPELLQAYTGPATYSTAFNMSECRPYPL